MLLPAALEQWAAEHNEQLSAATLGEVRRIAGTIAESPLGDLSIHEIAGNGSTSEQLGPRLGELFPMARAERAATLIQVVVDWASKQGPPPAAAPAEDPKATRQTSAPSQPSGPSFVPPTGPLPRADAPDRRADDQVATAPAFLRSDKVDEEDDVRLYGPKRRWKAILGTLAALLLLGGAGFGAWYWLTQRDDTSDETVTAPEPEATAAPQNSPEPTESTTAPTTLPTVTPEPTPEPPSFWADIGPILNSGNAEITASTYAVSPANRAVLTGHTAAITGVVISDDGRVLTSGADRRLVDWGADVTLANPDVLNVPSPLTVLERTADQHIIAGDTDGTITVIDLVDAAEPTIINVHDVAISAATELPDGRIAVASADGDVAVFAIDTPDDRTELPHGVEVTAVVALPDGMVATAAVDGIVRLWPSDGSVTELPAPADEGDAGTEGDEGDAGSEVDEGDAGSEGDGTEGDGTEGDTTEGDATAEATTEAATSGQTGGPGEIATLDAPVTAMALLSDGRLATASVNGAIHVVPAAPDATEIVVLPGHIGAVRALFELTMPDGSTALASGGDDTTIRLWDLDTRAQILVLEGHGDIISGLDVLPDGRLVSTSGDGTGRVWDLTVPAGRTVIPPHDGNLSALHSIEGDRFVTGGTDGKVVLAATAETSEPTLLTEHDAPIVGVSRLQSGDIVSLDAASMLRINQPDGDPAGQVELELAPGATALDVRPGLGIVTGHADGTVRFHDLNEEVLSVDVHGSGVNDVASLTGGLVASAGQDRTVRIIDPENPGQLPVFDLHTSPVDVVIELPDGRIASAGSDGIYVYTVEGLAQDHVRLNGQRSRTISLVGLSDNRLISTGDDGRIRLWDLNSPESEPITLIDIPGVVNPHLIQVGDTTFVAGAARGYVVFDAN